MNAAQPPSDCGDASPLLVRAKSDDEWRRSTNGISGNQLKAERKSGEASPQSKGGCAAFSFRVFAPKKAKRDRADAARSRWLKEVGGGT